jgi:hypothetical protein
MALAGEWVSKRITTIVMTWAIRCMTASAVTAQGEMYKDKSIFVGIS